MVWIMKECEISFCKIATYDSGRNPRVLIDPDPMEWIEERNGRINWLISPSTTTDQWKAMVSFPNETDTVIFKLTFG